VHPIWCAEPEKGCSSFPSPTNGRLPGLAKTAPAFCGGGSAGVGIDDAQGPDSARPVREPQGAGPPRPSKTPGVPPAELPG